MDSVCITYEPRPDATSESELTALAAVYAFVLEAHAQKNVTKRSGQEGEQGDKEPPLRMVAQEKTA